MARATEPFVVNVPDATLDDLRARLQRTRWPEVFAGRGWEQGTSVDYLKELTAWWLERFDWRAQEAALNELSHFRARVDGTMIHFVHERGRGPNPLPLVLTHGWPSSFYEYVKIVPLLVDPAAHGGDPADSFDVVVPSLPGYGFSDPLPPGESRRVPELWARLMTDVLGYDRFGAYGGDIGGMVTNLLALEFPEKLVGIVTSFLAEPYVGPGSAPLTSDETAFLERRRAAVLSGGNAYWHMLGTRPQTVAFGMTDSPTGLASWIVEKWREWSDCDGDVERRFGKDELLTTVMLYWVTETAASSAQIYADWKLGFVDEPSAWADRPEVPPGIDSKPLGRDERIEVPAGIVLFSLARWPREWAERAYSDIRRFAEMPRGGHFGAFEEPELLAEEFRELFRPLRP